MAVSPTIVCGIDGTGKTPLIDMVIDHWDGAILPKVIRPPMAVNPELYTGGESFQYIFSEMRKWLLRDGYWIYDRFPYPDELVYGGLKHPYPDSVKRFYDGQMGKNDVRIVYIEPGDAEKYIARMAESPDPFFKTHDRDLFFRIIETYEDILNNTNLKVMRIDGGRDLTLSDAKDVVRFIRG